MKTILIVALTLMSIAAPAFADPATDKLAQAVASMQVASEMCQFGVPPEDILARSAQLGSNPSDPSFVQTVAAQRQILADQQALFTPELRTAFCSSNRELLSALGL